MSYSDQNQTGNKSIFDFLYGGFEPNALNPARIIFQFSKSFRLYGSIPRFPLFLVPSNHSFLLMTRFLFGFLAAALILGGIWFFTRNKCFSRAFWRQTRQ